MLRVVSFAVTCATAVVAQSPAEKCRSVLFKDCGTTRDDPEVCMRCISENWNQTGSDCTFGEE
jgi:hypothetical protein